VSGFWNFRGNIGNGVCLLHLELSTNLETQTVSAVTSLITSSGNEFFVLVAPRRKPFLT